MNIYEKGEDASGMVHAHINVGSGQEVSIRQLAEIVQDVVGFQNPTELQES